MLNKSIRVILNILLFIGLAGCQSSFSPETSPLLVPTVRPSQVKTLNATTTSFEQQPLGSETSIGKPDLETTYTVTAPVTDNQQISYILEELLSRFLSQFSRAGWYHFPTDGRDSFWMHIPVAGTDTFDQFLWARQYPLYTPGFVWPASIVLADGSWGITQISNELDSYQIRQGGKQPERPTVIGGLDCFAGDNMNSGIFGNTALIRYIFLVQNPDDDLDRGADVTRTFSGWVEAYEGQAAFVLLSQETFPGVKPRMNDTRAVIDREDIYTYFDLKTGGRIAEKYVYILEGGDSQEDGRRFNQHLVEYHTALPMDVQNIYDQAAEKLRIYLDGK